MSAPLTGSRCQCGACGRVFSSTTGFDDHRAGDYRDSPPNYGRRCRNDAELTARGLMLADGVWRYPPPQNPPAHWKKTPVSGRTEGPTGRAPA